MLPVDRDPSVLPVDRDPGVIPVDRDPGVLPVDKDPGVLPVDKDPGVDRELECVKVRLHPPSPSPSQYLSNLH